eukprot:6209395-Pleurochrysis_carterae.AAC.1
MDNAQKARHGMSAIPQTAVKQSDLLSPESLKLSSRLTRCQDAMSKDNHAGAHRLPNEHFLLYEYGDN